MDSRCVLGYGEENNAGVRWHYAITRLPANGSIILSDAQRSIRDRKNARAVEFRLANIFAPQAFLPREENYLSLL